MDKWMDECSTIHPTIHSSSKCYYLNHILNFILLFASFPSRMFLLCKRLDDSHIKHIMHISVESKAQAGSVSSLFRKGSEQQQAVILAEVATPKSGRLPVWVLWTVPEPDGIGTLCHNSSWKKLPHCVVDWWCSDKVSLLKKNMNNKDKRRLSYKSAESGC